ncbi:MAG: STM4012 family radical SAM protein [Acidobacteriota bacterium]
MSSMIELFKQTPYLSYAYSYPHKTAYRLFEQPKQLSKLFAREKKDSLFLYLHIPFCEMRCGFCNLFTTIDVKRDLESDYLDALTRQAKRVSRALGAAKFTRMAIGGGTPTFVSLQHLYTLFDIAEKIFAINLQAIPISVETSPLTAEPEKLRLLRERGVSRISIGVQSFIDAEVAAVGRSQKCQIVKQALDHIRDCDFPALNIDLMYGLPGQTAESWLKSLHQALQFSPEEIYIYPLYVRPLTGLNRTGKAWDDIRLTCYRAGREFLCSAGYRQVSMRMFQAPQVSTDNAPVYCCQNDGMIGLGCGARSYTREVHYSTEYATGTAGIREILADYIGRSDEQFDYADYGFTLDRDEQQRRFIIQSLLQVEGLFLPAYQDRFGSDPLVDFSLLKELINVGLAYKQDNLLRLTEQGIERSDNIGYGFYSERVYQLMESYALR